MKQGGQSVGINNKETCTLTSRPNSSHVRIDSISINIDAAEESKSVKCAHFSIRGFVADNSKNGNPSWPFSAHGNDGSSEDITSRVHPLDTPKFKWWLCQSCLSEIDAEEASETINSSGSRLLKTKSSRVHRSLEDVLAHLSKKLKQPSDLECVPRKGTKSMAESTQKQIVVPALDVNTGVRETKLPSAESDFASKQHVLEDSNNQFVTLKNVEEHQKQLLRPAKTTSSRFGIANGAKLRGRRVAEVKLVHNQQNHDDSGGTGRRKTKTRKVRFLNELFDRDKNGVQPADTGDFPVNEAAQGSCSASGQKKDKKCLKLDSRQSQMRNVYSSGGKGEKRKARDINSASAGAEMLMTSEDEGSVSIKKKDGKINLGSKHVAEGSYEKSQKRNVDSCTREGFMSTYQPVRSKATNPQHSTIIPYSQIKENSNDALDKFPGGMNVLAPSDSRKELDGDSLPKKPMETVQIGNQRQFAQHELSSKSQYLFSDGCLDTRKGTKYYVPHTENVNLRNGDAMQNMGESSSACKYLVDKNMSQETKSSSDLKRPNRGPCVGSKKAKHSARTEGLNAVHRTEFMNGNRNNKVIGSRENPEITPLKFNDNMQKVGTSDDIPMEIVELMAKYQYERRVHNVADYHHVSQSGSNTKHDVVGSTSVQSNVVSRAEQNKKSGLPNAWVTSEKGSAISNKQLDSYMKQIPSTGSTYGPVLSSQQGLSNVIQSSALGSRKPDIFRNYELDMNFPPEHIVSTRLQAPYEGWQSAFQQTDKAALVAWPMLPPNHPVHMFSPRQGNASQPFDFGKVPASSSYVVEGRGLDSMIMASSRQTISASHLNRTDSRSLMMRSPNPYANETIPAMHLLSLKDGDMQLSTPTNKKAIANRKTFDKSFSNDHLAKELSGNNFGLVNSNHNLQQPLPYGYQSKVLGSDAPCKCSPPVPIFGSVVSSQPLDVVNKKDIRPWSHRPDRNHLNKNAGGCLLPSEKNGFISQKSRLASTTSLLPGQELVPANELSKHNFNPLWSGSGSTHSYKNCNTSEYYTSKLSESYETSKRRSEHIPCCVNRNPMDFTAPGPENEFMIGAEDLKLRNRYYHTPYYTGPMATNALWGLSFTTYTSPNNRL